MSTEILIQDNISKKTFEVSEIMITPKLEQKLNDGCSKLTFDIVKDNILKFNNGSVMRFKYNNSNMFYGYIFKKQRKDKNIISVTAYDQLRYWKAKDSITFYNTNIAAIIRKLAGMYGSRIGKLANTTSIGDRIEDNKTMLDMVYNAISETLKITGNNHVFYDNFGELTLEDVNNMKTNILIGDASNCTGYDLTQTIDNDTYNQIKLVSDNTETKKREVYITRDSSKIAQWGLLQYYEKVSNMNYAQIVNKANTLLKTKNREQLQLKLDSIGIESLKPGNSVFVKLSEIDDVSINNFFIIEKITHKFDKTYTMSLDLKMPSAEVLQ